MFGKGVEEEEGSREAKILPFYSKTVIVGTCIFFISCIYILIQNIIAYRKYGIFHQNEFYTVPYETLKTLYLFLCVVGAILLGAVLFLF